MGHAMDDNPKHKCRGDQTWARQSTRHSPTHEEGGNQYQRRKENEWAESHQDGMKRCWMQCKHCTAQPRRWTPITALACRPTYFQGCLLKMVNIRSFSRLNEDLKLKSSGWSSNRLQRCINFYAVGSAGLPSLVRRHFRTWLRMKLYLNSLGKGNNRKNLYEEGMEKSAKGPQPHPYEGKIAGKRLEDRFGLFELWPNSPPEETNTMLE